MLIEFNCGASNVKLACEPDYEEFHDADLDTAKDTLINIVQDDRFCKPGYRNDSVVDAMICCFPLGLDFEELLDCCLHVGWIDPLDRLAALDKMRIVADYLDPWYAAGFDYAFNMRIGTVG